MGTMHRWIVVCATVIVAACDQYKEPLPPRDVQPLTTRSREMGWSGIDYAGTGQGKEQRNGTAGVNSDNNDDTLVTTRLTDPGPPAGTGVFGPGTGVTDSPGRGTTVPTPDRDSPQMRNRPRRGRLYRPGHHYVIKAMTVGPTGES